VLACFAIRSRHAILCRSLQVLVLVILIQLLVFAVFFAIRGRSLLGWHLSFQESYGLARIGRNKSKRIISLSIGLEHRALIPLVVRREKAYHRWLKMLGIASELKLTDPYFDSNYFVTSDLPGNLDFMTHSTALAEAIQSLFKLNVTALHATTKRIWCDIDKADVEREPQYFTLHREIMGEIAQICEKAQQDKPLQQISRRMTLISIGFISVHAGLLALGSIGMAAMWIDTIDTLDTGKLILFGILAGIVGLAGWLVLFRSTIRGSSWSAWVMVDMVLAGIAGFLLSGIVATRQVNAYVAQSAPNIIEQPVTLKACWVSCKKSCGRRCTRRESFRLEESACIGESNRNASLEAARQRSTICSNNAWFEMTIGVEDWRAAGTYSFSADGRQFDQARIGAPFRIPVQPGALGIGWVDTVTFGEE
jgi:hypothetical protein